MSAPVKLFGMCIISEDLSNRNLYSNKHANYFVDCKKKKRSSPHSRFMWKDLGRPDEEEPGGVLEST